MASKKKDDDLMFGDRLMPGPNPPVPGPVPPPGPLPPPGPHPMPGPIPPPPPPGLPTYPTCQFIEERFNVLRNEHTGIKNAEIEIKKGVDENKALLSDVASIATNGFASTTTNISNAKTEILGAVSGVEGKVDTAITDIGKVDDKVVAGFDGKSLTSVQGAIAEQVTTRSDAIDDANSKIWDRIGHTEGAPTIEAAIKTAYDKIGHEQERTIEKLVQEETNALDDAVQALHEKVGTSTTPNGVGETTIEGTILAAHGFEIQSITGAQADIKVKIGTEHTTTRNHITTKSEALTNTVNEAKADIRSALGLSNTQEHANRSSLWDKVHGVETKVDTVDAVVDRVEGTVNSIHTETTSVKSTTESTNTIAGNIKSDTSSIKTTVETNGTVVGNIKADTTSIKTAVESTATAVGGVAGNVSEVKGALTTMSGTLTSLNGTLASIASDAADAKESSAGAATASALADVAESVNIIRGSIAGEGSNPIAEIKAAVTNVEYGNQALANLLTSEDFGLRAIKIMVNTLTTMDAKLDAINTKLDVVEANVNERLTAVETALDTLNEQVALLVAPEEPEPVEP